MYPFFAPEEELDENGLPPAPQPPASPFSAAIEGSFDPAVTAAANAQATEATNFGSPFAQHVFPGGETTSVVQPQGNAQMGAGGNLYGGGYGSETSALWDVSRSRDTRAGSRFGPDDWNFAYSQASMGDSRPLLGLLNADAQSAGVTGNAMLASQDRAEQRKMVMGEGEKTRAHAEKLAEIAATRTANVMEEKNKATYAKQARAAITKMASEGKVDPIALQQAVLMGELHPSEAMKLVFTGMAPRGVDLKTQMANDIDIVSRLFQEPEKAKDAVDALNQRYSGRLPEALSDMSSEFQFRPVRVNGKLQYQPLSDIRYRPDSPRLVPVGLDQLPKGEVSEARQRRIDYLFRLLEPYGLGGQNQYYR